MKRSERVYLEAYTSLLLVQKEKLVRSDRGQTCRVGACVPSVEGTCSRIAAVRGHSGNLQAIYHQLLSTSNRTRAARQFASIRCQGGGRTPTALPAALPTQWQEEFYGKEVIVADREMVEMVRQGGGSHGWDQGLEEGEPCARHTAAAGCGQ